MINFNVFNNGTMTSYYSAGMHTSGEEVHILDEAERLQLVSYPRIRSLLGLHI